MARSDVAAASDSETPKWRIRFRKSCKLWRKSGIRLVVDGDSAAWSGTGFAVTINVDSPIGVMPCPVIVTNKHVVHDARRIHFWLTTHDDGSVKGFKQYEIDTPADWVIEHPDASVDLAVISLFPIVEEVTASAECPFFIPLNRKEIATESELEWIAPGMPVMMIGYPNGLWDQANNLPLFRSGVAATHAGVRFDNRDEFVVDMACFPGSSGSPVWFLSIGSYTNKYGHIVTGTSTGKLLGVLYSGPEINADGTVQAPDGSAMVASTPMMMNLGFVIRATRILDFEPILAQCYIEWLKKIMSGMTAKGLLEKMPLMKFGQSSGVSHGERKDGPVA